MVLVTMVFAAKGGLSLLTVLGLGWEEKGSAHESQREYNQCADAVRQHAPPENLNVARAHEKVPEEIARAQSLYCTRSTSVAPHTALPIQVAPLIVLPHNP